VIVYSDTDLNPPDSESNQARQIVSQEFGIDEGASGVVVITDSDVRGDDVRDFTLALNRTLQNDRTLDNLSNITAVYDLYYQLLLGYTSVTHLQLYQMKSTTELATWLELGIPATYVSIWRNLVLNGPANPTLAQVSQYNQQANQTAWPTVEALTAQPYRSIALAYLNQFYLAWNQTFTAPSYTQFQLTFVPDTNGPSLRAQNVTKGSPLLSIQPSFYNITLPFFLSLGLDPQIAPIFIGAVRFFNLYCSVTNSCTTPNYWNDPVATRIFVTDTFAQAVIADSVQRTIIGQTYDLGPTPSAGTFASFSSQILRTYNIGSAPGRGYPVHPSHAVYSQFISNDNKTMLVILDFRAEGPDPRTSIQKIRDSVKTANLVSNQDLAVYVTGAPAFSYDIETETVRDIERIDPITVLLITIIIGIFFASLVVPLVPVSAIGLSIGVAFGLVYAIGSVFTGMHFLVLTLLPVAMLGVGADYCLFLINRYSEERRTGRGKKDAVERAVTWAGESIATSGATVVICFASLAIASYGTLRSIGIAATLGISVALLVSLTLVPATLVLFGDRLFWPRGVGLWRKKREKHTSYYAGAAKFTAKHSKLILITALLITLPAASNVLSSQVNHDVIAQVPNALESKVGYNVMSRSFGPGTITPSYIIVQTPVLLYSGNTVNITALQSVSAAENSTLLIPGVSKVYGPTRPSGEPIPYSTYNQLTSAEQEQMLRSMKLFLGKTGMSAMIWAVLSTEPYSDSAIKTVNTIRENTDQLRNSLPLFSSSTIYVGGATASVADLAAANPHELFNTGLLVFSGVFIILLVALGSVFTPLRLIFTILLSISWAMAMVLFIAENLMGTQLMWMLPVMLMVLMVGLGLDYDILLVTRIREYVASGAKDEEAIENAVEHTGGIISASGLVTAGAYGTMMLSRIPMLQQLGLAIFIVVLLDSFLVRIYLVPAIMMHMKRLNWWAPGPLRRVPVRPEDSLIPPIPLKTKLAVSSETLILALLGTALYLDYANNAFLREFVNRTVANILAGINVWTGVILGLSSFLVTYLLLREKIRPGQFSEKIRNKLRSFHPAKAASIAPGLSPSETSVTFPAPTPSPVQTHLPAQPIGSARNEVAQRPAEKKEN